MILPGSKPEHYLKHSQNFIREKYHSPRVTNNPILYSNISKQVENLLIRSTILSDPCVGIDETDKT